MAEAGSLPTGFGELEVLAVGVVLLVEGEQAAQGGARPSGGPESGCGSEAGEERSPTPLCWSPGAFGGCTGEPRRRSQERVRQEGL